MRTKERKITTKMMKMKQEFPACLPNRVRSATNVLPLGRDSWSTLLFIQVKFPSDFHLMIAWFYIVFPLGAKCLVEECDWTNPVPKDKSRLKQHMLNAHAESIPTARTATAH